MNRILATAALALALGAPVAAHATEACAARARALGWTEVGPNVFATRQGGGAITNCGDGTFHMQNPQALIDSLPDRRPSAPLAPSAAPHLNANQRKVGCSILSGQVFCPSPGTGMCWKKGHDPYLGQPAQAISVGNGAWSNGPDEGHEERCS